MHPLCLSLSHTLSVPMYGRGGALAEAARQQLVEVKTAKARRFVQVVVNESVGELITLCGTARRNRSHAHTHAHRHLHSHRETDMPLSLT
jgi:hypothetical protein